MKIVKLQHSIYENITSPDYWAKFNCKSYQGFEVVDIESVTTLGFVCHYKFLNDGDAVIFALRWKR